MISLALPVMMFEGCATVTVDQPANGATSVAQPANGRDVGITYYEPMFVMVVSCSEGKASAEIKTLPDYSKPRVVRWSNGLFTNAHPSVTLGDGWRLDGFDSEVTSTMGDVAGAVGTVVAAAVAPAAFDGGGKVIAPIPAGMYRMLSTASGWAPDVSHPMISLGQCANDHKKGSGNGTKPEKPLGAPAENK